MASVAILGATGTIGSTLARRLAGQGRSLLLVGRNADKLDSLSRELQQPFAVVDFRQSNALEAALEREADGRGGYDGLVNCVGSLFLKSALATSDDEFREVLETNLFTSFSLVRAAARLLRRQGGSVVLFGSAAAEIGIANHEAIAAAKAGVIGLARSAAASLAPNNIRVNVVNPGLVRTEMTRRIWESASASAASQDMHALGRLGEPEQIASLAAWLLEVANDWITGQVIGVDGGLSRVLPQKRSRS